jgi:hypothetical protein
MLDTAAQSPSKVSDRVTKYLASLSSRAPLCNQTLSTNILRVLLQALSVHRHLPALPWTGIAHHLSIAVQGLAACTGEGLGGFLNTMAG